MLGSIFLGASLYYHSYVLLSIGLALFASIYLILRK